MGVGVWGGCGVWVWGGVGIGGGGGNEDGCTAHFEMQEIDIIDTLYFRIMVWIFYIDGITVTYGDLIPSHFLVVHLNLFVCAAGYARVIPHILFIYFCTGSEIWAHWVKIWPYHKRLKNENSTWRNSGTVTKHRHVKRPNSSGWLYFVTCRMCGQSHRQHKQLLQSGDQIKQGTSLKESCFAFIWSCELNWGIATKYNRQPIVGSRWREVYFVTIWRIFSLLCCVQYRVFLHDRPWISPWIKSISNELDISVHVIASQLSRYCDVIRNRLWRHQWNEDRASETRGRCVKIVVFIVI